MAVDALSKPFDRKELHTVLGPYLDATGSRVLVVDDDADTRLLLRELITAEGLRVEEASNGQQALDYLASNDADLMILDLMMPGMSGTEVLARVREDPRNLGLPVIVVTARQLTPDQADALERQGAAVVEKGGQLAGNLRAVLSRALRADDRTGAAEIDPVR